MRLEETIRRKLFRSSISNYDRCVNNSPFVIECKWERGKPVPLCVPNDALMARTDLIYKKLYLTDSYYSQERSTPRALYNLIFSNYFCSYDLMQVKIKDIIYYASPGVLFNADKIPLFYFAYEFDEQGHTLPRLFITPTLLTNASLAGKPMEKFFMSTIVPYVLNNRISTARGFEAYTKVEIDNQVDNTFFLPESDLISSVPVDRINSRLNDILADNADTLAAFVDNYASIQSSAS